MTEIQNSKGVYDFEEMTVQICFGHWVLEFEIYLEFGAWGLWFYQVSQTSFQRFCFNYLKPGTCIKLDTPGPDLTLHESGR